MKIIITGATGMVGKKLKGMLESSGHQIITLTTGKISQKGQFFWNPEKDELDENSLEGIDGIVHLAGANIMSESWSDERKKVIINSRVKGTELLLRKCLEKQISPKFYISASGVGYYGDGNEHLLSENDKKGSGFAAEVCDLWEKAADKFVQTGAKVSKLRIGIVLSKEGGFIKEMKKLASFKILSAMGNGRQFISWIDIEDLCSIFIELINNKIPAGTYNAVAPNPERNETLAKMMAKQWHAPTWLPAVPAFMLKIVLGERANELLASQNVSSQKIETIGFTFKFPTALESIQKNA